MDLNSETEEKPKVDRKSAMLVLRKAQEIYEMLPEFDCGACGSPNCVAFSRDVAEGNAVLSDCVMLDRKQKKD